MIRFIQIGDQIMEETNQFAFYDTVTDKFLSFNDTQVFDDWEEFDLFWDGDNDAFYHRLKAFYDNWVEVLEDEANNA